MKPIIISIESPGGPVRDMAITSADVIKARARLLAETSRPGEAVSIPSIFAGPPTKGKR